jgi:pyruvate kinase
MARTKIVATLGPASNSPERIEELIRAGVDVFRVNFSHGDPDKHRETIRSIRSISDRIGILVGILGDLSGPKIRCGKVAGGPFVPKAGELIRLVMNEDFLSDTPTEFGVTYPELINEVEVGHRISMNDGNVVLRVVAKDRAAGETGKGVLTCSVESPGIIDSRKGINCPDSSLTAPPVTEHDKRCIKVGVEEGLDYFAISFVRSAADVRLARQAVRQERGDVPLIAKVERHEAIASMEEIVREADGVMVARGDLGVEIPMERVPLAQKRLIGMCNRLGKPVITATQMMESMIQSHRPTRAEVADVANAIFDGTDAVMLSGETAVGAYPVEAVRIMERVCLAAETELPKRDLDFGIFGHEHAHNVSDALSRAAVAIAEQIGCKAIICSTRYGSTPRLIARLRPKAATHTFTPRRASARRLKLVWGVEAHYVPAPAENEPQEAPLVRELRLAIEKQIIQPGDRVALISGLSLDNPEAANMLRVLEV